MRCAGGGLLGFCLTIFFVVVFGTVCAVFCAGVCVDVSVFCLFVCVDVSTFVCTGSFVFSACVVFYFLFAAVFVCILLS